MAGQGRASRTGELSRQRLAIAETPEDRFAAASDLVRTTAKRMCRSRDEMTRARGSALLHDATAYLLSLTTRRSSDAA